VAAPGLFCTSSSLSPPPQAVSNKERIVIGKISFFTENSSVVNEKRFLQVARGLAALQQ
jgi:hypothetical protein